MRLDDLVISAVTRRPDAVAITCGDRQFSYEEVARGLFSVAKSLRQLGAGPGSRVALHGRRTPEFVIAMLGALYAGGCVTPLDGNWPAARVNTLVTALDPAVVISDSLVSTGPWKQLTFTSALSGVPAAAADAAGQSRERAGDGAAAFIIFTSGSTGTPKGVMLDHRGRAANVADLCQRLEISAADSLVSVSSPGFDMFVADCFCLLASGGTLVLHEEDPASSMASLARRLLADEVTIWNSVPMLLHLLADHAERSAISFPRVRHLVLGGDWAAPSLLSRAATVFPSAQAHVLGGATEASIHSTWHSVVPADLSRPSVPYGRAMAGQRTLVLGPGMQPVPPGDQGELYLAGIGVAWGYLGDARRTAERFLPDVSPGASPGDRMYATGDLVRMEGDELSLYGRADEQIQVGGFRVEPREVEVALEALPAVSRASVIGRPVAPGICELVAVVQSQEAIEEPAMRAALAQVLPAPMVPQRIVAVAQTPLNPNGKVDRRALAALVSTAGSASVPQPQALPGEAAVAQGVAAAYAEVLGRPVGADDALLDCGETSMTALAVQREIELRLGLKPPLSVVLLEPVSSVIDEMTRLREGQADGVQP